MSNRRGLIAGLCVVLGLAACGDRAGSAKPAETPAQATPQQSEAAATVTSESYCKKGETRSSDGRCVSIEQAPTPALDGAVAITTASAAAPPPVPRSTASDDLWAAARREDADSDATLLRQVNDDLTQLERAKEPWGDTEIALLQSCMRKSTVVMNHREVGLDPRVEKIGDRIKKLVPALKRGIAHVDDVEWERAKDKCTRATELPECNAALAFAGKESRHSKDAQVLAQSPHVGQLKKEWAVAEQKARERLAEACLRCMATCNGNGTSNWICRDTDHCGGYCR